MKNTRLAVPQFQTMMHALQASLRGGFFVVLLGVCGVFVFGMQPVSAVAYGIPPAVGQATTKVSAPQDVQLVNTMPTKVQIQWSSSMRSIFHTAPSAFSASTTTAASDTNFSESTTPLTYEVAVYRKKNGRAVGDPVRTVSTMHSMVTLDGLKKNTAYVMEVRAQRDDMNSEPVYIHARTTPAAPKVFSAHRIGEKGSYATAVQWVAPKGVVRYYTMDVYTADNAHSEKVMSVKTCNPRAELSGLAVGQKYRYTVRAHFNDEYRSTASAPHTFVFGQK